MIVSELIEKLKVLPQDMPVVAENDRDVLLEVAQQEEEKVEEISKGKTRIVFAKPERLVVRV